MVLREKIISGIEIENAQKMSKFSYISADLEATVANHETRLTAAEENIQGMVFHLQLNCVCQ